MFRECVVFLIHKKLVMFYFLYITHPVYCLNPMKFLSTHISYLNRWTQLIFFAYTGKNQYNTVADFFRNIFTSRRQAAKILYLYLIAYIIYIYHKMFFLLFCTDKYFKDTATPAASCSFLLSVSLLFCFLAYLVDILCVK